MRKEMATRRYTELTLAACVLAISLAGPALAQAPPAEAPERSLRPDISVHTLDNGLTIYALEDHSAPLVAYEVWFKVGSSYEHEGTGGEHGITGLSHFFEHMMFRGTKAHRAFFEDVYALGGKMNAWTWVDSTVYWEKVPSRYLGKIIDMEADRLRNMDMSFLSLEPEREVVKSERLLRSENDPDGAMQELFDATTFRVHPYRWPTVGWMSDLNAITLEEASAYHKTYYAPNNAYVVIVGDFDTDAAVEQVRKAYGDIPAAKLPADERRAEPTQTAERRDFISKPVDSSRFVMGYRIPSAADPDFMVLEVIDQVLTGGKSSRLEKELVYSERPAVQSLGTSLYPVRDPYSYLFNVTMMAGHANSEALQAITREMERLGKEPVSANELEKAKNRLVAASIKGILTNQQRADTIGFGVLTGGDPYLYFDRLTQYESVTPEDIRRVAAKMLTPANRTIVTAVDPKRLGAVTEALTGAAPASVEGLDAALATATALTQRDLDLAHDGEQLSTEQQAIELLGVRAKKARRDYAAAKDEEHVAALDKYMSESEKGTKIRTERAKEQKAALDKARAEQAAAWEALGADAKKLAKAAKAGTPSDAARAKLLDVLLRRGKGKGPLASALSKDLAPEDRTLLSVHEAAWLDRAGKRDAAEGVRREALAWLADAKAGSALATAREWVEDTLRQNTTAQTASEG